MMNRREKDSLDRYITGNYGEDQFKGGPEDEDDLDETLGEETDLDLDEPEDFEEYEEDELLQAEEEDEEDELIDPSE